LVPIRKGKTGRHRAAPLRCWPPGRVATEPYPPPGSPSSIESSNDADNGSAAINWPSGSPRERLASAPARSPACGRARRSSPQRDRPVCPPVRCIRSRRAGGLRCNVPQLRDQAPRVLQAERHLDPDASALECLVPPDTPHGMRWKPRSRSRKTSRVTTADLRAICESFNDERGMGGQSRLVRLLDWHYTTVWRKHAGKSPITQSAELAIQKGMEQVRASANWRSESSEFWFGSKA
jgi:hypothetical protein